MVHHQTVGIRHRHTGAERQLEPAQQTEQDEGDEDRKQRQGRAQFLSLQIAPDQVEEFHSGLVAESWPLSK